MDFEDFSILLFEMCSRVSCLNFLFFLERHEFDWALANVFEGLDFLSQNYCEHNKTAHSNPSQKRSIKFSVGLPQPRTS